MAQITSNKGAVKSSFFVYQRKEHTIRVWIYSSNRPACLVPVTPNN